MIYKISFANLLNLRGMKELKMKRFLTFEIKKFGNDLPNFLKFISF